LVPGYGRYSKFPMAAFTNKNDRTDNTDAFVKKQFIRAEFRKEFGNLLKN
jgi:hypothetical protein